MYFITTKRMLEVCFSVHPNIQYRTLFYLWSIQALSYTDIGPYTVMYSHVQTIYSHV